MMLTFFHGWRRKAGCLTLVMALAFVAFWIRSSRATDVINLRDGPMSSVTFISERSGVALLWTHNEDRLSWNDDGIDGSYVALNHQLGLDQLLPVNLKVEWKSLWYGLRYGHAWDVRAANAWAVEIKGKFGDDCKPSEFKGIEADVVIIPHWLIILPLVGSLVLLSARLLCSKPCKPTEAPPLI